MSLVLTTTPVQTVGTKQFNEYPIQFIGYQVKDTIISNKLYLDNSSAYPATAVATGSVSVQTSRYPLSGDLYETIYDPANTASQVPLVGQRRNYTRVTAAANNDGAKWTINMDLSNENWFVLVVKSASTSIAGKLKIRSSVGNEAVCAFTTSSTANTWESKIFDFKTAGTPGVTWTGTPVFSGITEIEITLDAASNADFAMIYAVNNYSQIIGQKLSYAHACVSEVAFENTLDAVDLICGQQTVARSGSKRTASLMVGAQKKDMEAQSVAIGDVIKNKSNYVPELINSTEVQNKAFSAGAITLTASLNIARVYIEGVGNLKEYHTATSIPEGAYHYNSSTGVLTVNTLYNSKVPTVYIHNLRTLPTRSVKNLELGYVGRLVVPRRTENGKYEFVIAKKAQVMLESEDVSGDNYSTVKFKYEIYPVDGLYFDVATEI